MLEAILREEETTERRVNVYRV